MKVLMIFLFILFGTIKIDAQKYILLDKEMSQAAFYTDDLSVTEKYKGFFPVEANNIEKFIAVLRDISQTLSSKNIMKDAKQYQIGCDKFTGIIVHLASGNRLDYVLTSNCDKMKVSMHLSDAKLNNANNAYFINAWISYIKNNAPPKH